MNWQLMVPIDGSQLRKAVYKRISELNPIVGIKAKDFTDPSDVYDKTSEGREVEWLAAYGETIPRSGTCYINAELARSLRLYHPMNAEEIKLNNSH